MRNRGMAMLLAATLIAGSLSACGSNTATTTSTDTTGTNGTQQVTESTAEKVEIQTEATTSEVTSAYVDEINIASERDPTDMGPWAGNMGGASGIVPLVYQTMQVRELNADPEPCLAKTVTVVDEKTYNIELFDYIYDSEGNHFTSADVKWGVEEAQSIGKDNTAKAVDTIEIIDDYNFVVHFKDIAAMGDYEGFLCQLKFVTQAAYEAEGNKMAQHPIGTGPYVVSNYVSGSVIEFTQNEKYWQTDESYIARSSETHAKKINYQIITEALQRAIAVEGGTLDYGAVTLNDKNRLESAGYGIVPVPDNLTFMMFLNMDESNVLSQNKDLREAIFYAISNEQVSALFTEQDSVPVYDISNSNYPDYYEDYYKNENNYYKYDVDKAKELLASSGYDTSEPLTLLCSSDAASTEIAEIIKNFLAPIGLTVEIEAIQSQMLSNYETDPSNWDMYVLQYASTDYAVNVWEKVLNAAKHNGKTINFVDDEQLQTMLSDVRTIEGHTEESVEAMHDYIVDGAWCMGLVQGILYYATSDKFARDENGVPLAVYSEQRVIRPNSSIYTE